ncbi:hypothetical protein [Streptomyces colonosanans]|uniref:Uncharacterized protein n=1 Tax=Streptomyces colonosanans TaxID=1428652 RepID=A0A1S2PIR5_9ACTN|nr:hypothetical protein [Streptomyces colonosanans]OIJ93651.1 hypothetical protein BIV24_11815 [Streptomyces colonosanans]
MSQAAWDHEPVNDPRIDLLMPAPHDGGALFLRPSDPTPVKLVDVAFGFCWHQLPTKEPPVVSDSARAGAISLRIPELASLSITLAKGIGIRLYLPP